MNPLLTSSNGTMVSTCGRCHFNDDGSPVASMAELEEARQFGFEGDIDGDG